jgi:segregation and condensation protein A
VTFIAILELIKSSLVEIIQSEPLAPIHLKARTVLFEDEDRQPFEVSAAND